MVPGDSQGSQLFELGRAAPGDATQASVKNRMTIHSGALLYIVAGASLWYILVYTVGILVYTKYILSIYQRPVYTM